jgi:LysR family transcriptional regulator, glycine cleavage system transcriptional activator
MRSVDLANRVPPLLWVRAFEAAARHESFVIAAKELAVTPGAVSRAVRQLEAFMGVALFVRGVSGVELTSAARTYASAITPAIRQIALASAEMHTSVRQKVLRVCAMPALAQRWLVPRLGEFKDLHPDIAVLIAAQSVPPERLQTSFDVVLSYDDDKDAGGGRLELFSDEIFPVLSPRLADQLSLQQPADLFRLTALHDTYWESDWESWLGAIGLQAPKRWRGLYFTLYAMAVDAAVAGQGVLIGHGALIEDELRSGKLIAPFTQRVPCSERYYAHARPDRSSSSTVRAFMDWLADTAGGRMTAETHPDRH